MHVDKRATDQIISIPTDTQHPGVTLFDLRYFTKQSTYVRSKFSTLLHTCHAHYRRDASYPDFRHTYANLPQFLARTLYRASSLRRVTELLGISSSQACTVNIQDKEIIEEELLLFEATRAEGSK